MAPHGGAQFVPRHVAATKGNCDAGASRTGRSASGAEASLIDAERSEQVAVAIQGLPDRQREAIILVHYQELSSNEAATILEVSIEALESLLSRGRRHLKQQFSKQEHDDV